MVIEDDVVIKGKVISSDAEGNVYKSLYLVDDSGAIEVKLTTGLSTSTTANRPSSCAS